MDRDFKKLMQKNGRWEKWMRRRAKFYYLIAKAGAYSLIYLDKFHIVSKKKMVTSKLGKAYVMFVFGLLNKSDLATQTLENLYKNVDLLWNQHMKNLKKEAD